MENEFILSYRTACNWWQRPDLGSKPENMKQVAEVLRQAKIEVYSTNFSDDGWLVCEPCPERIYEALSGKAWNGELEGFADYSKENPGYVGIKNNSYKTGCEG